MYAGLSLGLAQHSRALSVSGVLVALALSNFAQAKAADQPGGQLIIDSFAPANIPSPEGTAKPVSFLPIADITLGSPRAPAGSASPVAAMMTAQFSAGRRTNLIQHGSGRAHDGAAISLPQSQSSALSAGNYQPVSGQCGSYSYRPSNSLKPENEAYRRLLLPYVVHEACAAGIPAGLLDALIIQESRYNALAISTKGAIGLTQLMPGTASHIGANAYSVVDNIRGGATYLRSMMDTFGGQAHLALAAYNAGPGAVVRYGGIPAFRETQGYVASILSLWGNLSQ